MAISRTTKVPEWLIHKKRNSPSRFAIIDTSENAPPKSDVIADLGKIVLQACVGSDFLSRAAEKLPWSMLDDIKAQTVPTLTNMTRGIFGESLASEVLTAHHGLEIPVQKITYRMSPNSSPTGTDIVAFKFDDIGNVERLCFVECKVRTSNSDRLTLVVDSHQQLVNDRDAQTPSMVAWIARILSLRNDIRSDYILEYLASRALKDIEEYRIMLFWEDTLWSETFLDALADEQEPLSPLTVHVVRIAGLRDVISRAYSSIRVKVDDDDD